MPAQSRNDTDFSASEDTSPDAMVCINGGLPVHRPVSAELTLDGLGLSVGEWSSADSEAVTRSVRASLGDPLLELEVLEVCFGACSEPASLRRLAQGQAVTVRFQMASPRLSSEELKARLDGPAFAEGFDSAMAEEGRPVQSSVTTQPLAQEVEGAGTYELEDANLVLTSCPVGFLIVNSSLASQKCDMCLGGTYSFSPSDGCIDRLNPTSGRLERVCEPRLCSPCPTGATCLGKNGFTSEPPEAEWETVRSSAGYQIKRLVRCPAGYVLVREESRPALDECRACPADTYSLVAASWPERVMVSPTGDRAVSLCTPCHYGATCNGLAHISPKRNFWRLPDPARRTEDEETERSAVARIYECPKHACLEGGVCYDGRDPNSPVCGTCKSGFALSSTVCTPCGDASSKALVVVVMVLLSLLFLATWWFFAWRPFFQKEAPPEEEWQDLDELSWFQRTWIKVKHFLKGSGKTMAAYLKVLSRALVTISISFFQVMSTFESTYTTEWPKVVEEVWEFGRALSINVFDFPGPNCMTEDFSHLQKLQLVTVTPVVVCVLWYIPTFILRLLGERETFRVKNTRDQFYHACLFFLFLIYPLVSTTSVQGFKCREIGDRWLLEVDLAAECPSKHPRSATFIWSVAATIMYPIGIPLFMFWHLRRARIPKMAESKSDNAVLHEMLLQYKEHLSGTVYRELTMHIGGAQRHHDERLILNRIKYMFDDASEGGGQAMTRRHFEQYLESIGIFGSQEDVQEVLMQFTVDQNGMIQYEDFAFALLQLVRKENQMLSTVNVDELDNEALAALCLFRWSKLAPKQDAAKGDPGLDNSAHSFNLESPRARTAPAAAFFEMDPSAGSGRALAPGSSSPGGSGRRDFLRLGGSRSEMKRTLAPSGAVERKVSGMSSSDGGGSPLGGLGGRSLRGGLRIPSKIGQQSRSVLLGANASREDMIDFLLYQGAKLITKGAISIPIVVWDGATIEERDAIDKLGFLFDNYKVQNYYYELLELTRKFIMTGVIIFVRPGSAEQLALAMLVSLLAMVYVMRVMPFANLRIGSLQSTMLGAQAATLFYGLLLHVDAMRQTLERESNFYNEVASAVVLILLCTVIFLLPPLTLIYDNRRELAKNFAPGMLHHRSRSKRHPRTDGPAVNSAAESRPSLDEGELRQRIELHASEAKAVAPASTPSPAATEEVPAAGFAVPPLDRGSPNTTGSISGTAPHPLPPSATNALLAPQPHGAARAVTNDSGRRPDLRDEAPIPASAEPEGPALPPFPGVGDVNIEPVALPSNIVVFRV